MWRSLKVAEDMVEEKVEIRVCCISVSLGCSGWCLAIIEHDDFVDARDCACTSDLTDERILKVMCCAAVLLVVMC